jgi:hypothetical protein
LRLLPQTTELGERQLFTHLDRPSAPPQLVVRLRYPLAAIGSLLIHESK